MSRGVCRGHVNGVGAALGLACVRAAQAIRLQSMQVIHVIVTVQVCAVPVIREETLTVLHLLKLQACSARAGNQVFSG